LTEAQSTVVTAYTGLSTGAAKAAVALQAAEPPTITGGDEVAAGFVTGFQNLADVYGRGAQTVAALTPSTASDIKSAIDAVEQEAKGAQPESMPDLDPGVQSAVEQLPECSNLGNYPYEPALLREEQLPGSAGDLLGGDVFDLAADRPAVPEGVHHGAVAIAGEGVRHGGLHRGARFDRAVHKRIGVRDIHDQR